MKNNFKIIAIEALTDCNVEFSKVLKKNQLYYFYSDYEITKTKKEEKIKIKDSYPESLYNIKGFQQEIIVNVCAIVGKNGSGKSTIIELLFRGINNIACNFLWEKENFQKTITAKLKVVKGVHVAFYYKTDWFYKIVIHDTNFIVYKFKSDMTLDKNCIVDNFTLGDLFYTEAINYSHYAYNSKEFSFIDGKDSVDWLVELFHKNDSYQTPLVLNPMRTEGNFDINRENELVKQRLLANLLRPAEGILNFRKLGDNLIAKKITLKLKEKKEYYSDWITDSGGQPKEKKIFLDKYTKAERRNIILKLMYTVVDGQNFDLNILDNKVYSHAEMYIIFKLTSICKKYNDYNHFFNRKTNKISDAKLQIFIEKLKKDSSHITFKLKQTLNYLKNDFIKFDNNKPKLLNTLSKSIDKIRKKNNSLSISELLPPPIFDVDIILNNYTNNDIVVFSSLSSGEKQLIYMTNSLLYHLNNIDSVVGDKIKYKNINIILEEIELYFHPDFQKSFIKYFLDSIERLELKNIQSINICLVTHSPFILSDIPSNNIMYLNLESSIAIQNTEMRKTFGANIHELLMDNFFLTDGFIGSFSKNKIEKVIKWINEKIDEKNKSNDTNFKIDENDIKYYQDLISIIDEPILKIKLSERLSELVSDKVFYNSIINGQINYLENLKK